MKYAAMRPRRKVMAGMMRSVGVILDKGLTVRLIYVRSRE